MARFGRRFRKARKRRQQRRQETVQTFIENRTARIQARQEGKTARTGLRQQGKSDRIQSKAEGGFFLPQSVQARQDSLMQGLKTAGAVATAGISSLGENVGGVLGNVDFPYGQGFQTSGFESVYSDNVDMGSRLTTQNIGEWVRENIFLVGAGTIALIFLLRK